MPYVNLDKITKAPHIENIVATEDMTNGVFCELEGLEYDGETVRVSKGGDQTKELVLHVSNGLVYDERENELDFVLKAGKVGRGYVIQDGNYVSFTKDLIDGTIAEGRYVLPNSEGVLQSQTNEPATGMLFGRIVGTEYNQIAGEMVIVRFHHKKASAGGSAE